MYIINLDRVRTKQLLFGVPESRLSHFNAQAASMTFVGQPLKLRFRDSKDVLCVSQRRKSYEDVVYEEQR